ncbi:hypothetical protein JOC85_003463 [Bacillus mesophilus]|nr:hypothetical protein [Bacillus mesophilus]
MKTEESLHSLGFCRKDYYDILVTVGYQMFKFHQDMVEWLTSQLKGM